MKVTRVAYSGGVNAGKYGELVEQACRLGRVRSLVWDRYGSITGVGLSDRRIRDAWMADGTATSSGCWRTRGKRQTCGPAIPGLKPRTSVAVPLNTTVAPTGTLRVILRGGQVEVHYQVDDTAVTSAHRPCGTATVGVDKGYSEVLTDSDGDHHGPELGELLRSRSDTLKERNAQRAKLRSIAKQAAQRGQHGKAERIRRNNLGTVKKLRQQRRWEQQVRTVTYRAVNAVVDKARVIVAEDLSRTFTGRKKRGADTNRRLAAWTTGITAEALTNVSGRERFCGAAG